MAVTAKDVAELRKRTGLGMMECKKLLTGVDGDLEKAVEEARKMGVKTKVASREAGEGRVASASEGNRAVAAELKCNTDFTAKSDVAGEVLDLVTKKLLADPGLDVANDAEIKDKLVAAGQSTGENVQITRTAVVEGSNVGNYQYSVTNKVAALIALDGGDDEVVRDLGLHLVANPTVALGATKDDLPADMVAKERELAVEAAKATGKPADIAEKIAEGKMQAFYKERALIDQPFINPDKFKGSIGEMLKQKGATLVDFKRLSVGE
ncbi:MAG: translation elongation factor Ts [Planctomycetota bacterium]